MKKAFLFVLPALALLLITGCETTPVKEDTAEVPVEEAAPPPVSITSSPQPAITKSRSSPVTITLLPLPAKMALLPPKSVIVSSP